jgi:hypothetical protein
LALTFGSDELVDSVSTDVSTDISGTDLEEQLRIAQRKLLESQATYALRNRIIESILITDPTLNAVHAGPKGTPAEQWVIRHQAAEKVLMGRLGNYHLSLSTVMI